MPYSVSGVAPYELNNLNLIESAFLSKYIYICGVNAVLTLGHNIDAGISRPTVFKEVSGTCENKDVLTCGLCSGLFGCGSFCGGSLSGGLYGSRLNSGGLGSCGLCMGNDKLNECSVNDVDSAAIINISRVKIIRAVVELFNNICKAGYVHLNNADISDIHFAVLINVALECVALSRERADR